MIFRMRSPAEVTGQRRQAFDDETLSVVAPIVDDVRRDGAAAARAWAERLGDMPPGSPLTYDRTALQRAVAELDTEKRDLLQRVADRIATFAQAQRACLGETSMAIPGGRAGHDLAPVRRVGCYAPGGRFPLPSTVLMTAVTARVADVQQVWVASPKPTAIAMAAAGIAGADGMLAFGGAQAIAAMAFGIDGVAPCDLIVGPGNAFVTAAKWLVSREVGIDMLAGPSELTVLCDGHADVSLVAADLLAQAEHDPDALPVLVTTSESVLERIDGELQEQLATLPTADVARQALRNGYAVLCGSLEEAAAVCDAIAPEHLEIHTHDPAATAAMCSEYGAVFIGGGAAETLGDYGAGPNHVLPTGGCARFTGGLSVFTFLRARTWMTGSETPDAADLLSDTSRLARLEGLEAHARAAERRLG